MSQPLKTLEILPCDLWNDIFSKWMGPHDYIALKRTCTVIRKVISRIYFPTTHLQWKCKICNFLID